MIKRKSTETDVDTSLPEKRRRRAVKAVNYVEVDSDDDVEIVSGPSVSKLSTSIQPASKRRQREFKPKKAKETPEKRLAKARSKCPQNILDRVERVRSQRFFMISRERVEDTLRETFQVLGSTGNVYTVTIDQTPHCNCPDAARGNHCKHILFIFLKVLQVDTSSNYWFQKALLSTELEIIFAHSPIAPNSVIHPRVVEAYNKAIGIEPSSSKLTTTDSNRKIPDPTDDCPICYESMGVNEKKMEFCETCRNALHSECFAQYKDNARRSRKDLTCVYCRAIWPMTSSQRGEVEFSANGYLNIGAAVGLNPMRDTSSYYTGPRRGFGGSVYGR